MPVKMYAHFKNLFRSAYLPVLTFITFLLLWQGLVETNLFPRAYLPPPLEVAAALLYLTGSGLLLEHIGASLWRFIWGYGLAAAAGIPLGLLLGRTNKAREAVGPLIQILRPISPIAWIPLAILWFGTGNKAAIFIIFLASFFIVLLSAAASLNQVEKNLLDMARNFGAKEKDLLLKVILPAAYPQILLGLQVALGAAWIHLVAGEMIAVQSGLGFLIIDSRNLLRYDSVIAAMLVIGLLGLFINWFIKKAGDTAARKWGFSYAAPESESKVAGDKQSILFGEK